MYDRSLPKSDRTDSARAEPSTETRPAKAIATRGGYLRGWFSSGYPRTTLILGQASVFFTAAAVEKEIARLRRRGLRAEPVDVTVTIGGGP